MAYTQEPRGLQIVNNLNMSTVGSLNTNVLWCIACVTFTVVASILMLRQDYYTVPAGATQAVLVVVELQRQAGLYLAGVIIFALTGKTVAGVTDSHLKRTANPEYAPVVEAKERGKVAGAAAAAVIAEKAADMKAVRENGLVTAERPAMAPVQVQAQGDVQIDAHTETNAAAPTIPVKHGAEPDSRTDDERGD